MPLSSRRWATGQRSVFIRSRGVRAAGVLCWLLATACMILLFVGLPSIGRSGWLAAEAAGMAIAAVTIQRRASRGNVRLYRGQVIFPESLDEACRVLLGRAQKAIATVLGSNVRAVGLLSNPIQDELLGRKYSEVL